MKIIYVASPYAGDIQKNTEFAKRACRHVMEQGHKVRATSAEVTEQTSSSAHLMGEDSVLPMCPPCSPRGLKLQEASSGLNPAGGRKGHAGELVPPARRTVSAANLQLSQKLRVPKGMV